MTATNLWPVPATPGFTAKTFFAKPSLPSAATGRATILLPFDVYEQAQIVIAEIQRVNPHIWRFFRMGNRIVRRVDIPGSQSTKLEPILRHQMLSAELSRLFKFRTVQRELASPPDPLLSFLLNADQEFWRDLPTITGVRSMPFFNRDGELVQTDGYHPAEGVWLDTRNNQVPEVSASPTQAEVDEATRWLNELLQDCQFADDASRNNALAAILTPHMREMIADSIPIQLIAAEAPGAGKSTLARLVYELSEEGPFTTLPEVQEEEFRKRVLSVLRDNPRILVIDNVNHRMDSGVFAGLITTPVFRDRALGGNEMEAYKNKAQWVLTANRPEISGELRRRTSLTRLTVNSNSPQNRGYHRPEIFSWFSSHRAQLHWSIFTLVQAWIAAGKPAGTVNEHGMRSYCQAVGGVLEHAGYGGVLLNMNQLHDQASREEEDFNTLVACWHSKHGTARVTATDIAQLLKEQDLYPDGLTAHQPALIGKKIKYWEGRTANGFIVRRPFDPANNRRVYQLESVKPVTLMPGGTGKTGATGDESQVVDLTPRSLLSDETGEIAPVSPDRLQA